MKILHTADWHLGKKLEGEERTEEHQQFLNWLLHCINEHHIDVLVVAGDIFDTGTPGNQSLKQYYSFLWQVKNTCCKHVVIIGGNHDSVSTLNAPADILKYLDIHIVSGVPENFEAQVIPLKNTEGITELVICAVPFLRDRDIKISIAGETLPEKETRIRTAIIEHYKKLEPLVQTYKESGIPVIATGHLYAAGATGTPESEKDIFVGNLGKIAGDQFPPIFDYIALGHLHKPQLVSNLEHIRYSGSPIALSFSEDKDPKQVIVIEFSEKNAGINIKPVLIPGLRVLSRLKGPLDKITIALTRLNKPENTNWPTWVEIQIQTDGFVPELYEQLNAIKPDFVEKLFIRQIKTTTGLVKNTGTDTAWHLSDLKPVDVFKQKLVAENIEEETAGELLLTFEEALVLLQSKEVE
ncbi:exonuclease SbcCD subunit D C-terminal domain-containing protein [Polluticaenibacter yanchengensis]|uniref:Nuclease SbcCD subunit D n=1 Tax=Polluticaenibacter yanchengensis TaxID=3014562 RepID=A0ABT4UI82_9BACT|nr:exonuclease SbcCD subunit D C-terminal domain-containing protein [Chitinophagaceae bacterium LY-5]